MGGIKINKKFKPLWTSDSNLFILTGGRGSGKSFVVGDFIENLTFEQGHTILFTRYTLTAASISIIPEFEEKINLEGHNGIFDINKTEIVNTSTGSKILFRGIKTSSGNQTANLKSIQNVTTWVLDEAEELIDEETFDKIDESIRKKGIQNRVVLMLNPPTKEHWIYKRFFEDAGVKPSWNGTKNGITYIHTTYLDNKENLSDKFLNKAELLKETHPDRYKHRMLGAFLDSAEGVVFDDWEYGEFNNDLTYTYGLDFGFFPDPDVLVKVAIDTKRKLIYVKEEFTLNNAGLNELARNIKTHVSNGLIIADSAEKRLISDLKAKGINVKAVKKGAGSILDGIKIMQDYKIIVDPKSTEIGKEMNNYAWSDKKNGVPVDAFNHRIDGIRYVCRTKLTENQRAKFRVI